MYNDKLCSTTGAKLRFLSAPPPVSIFEPCAAEQVGNRKYIQSAVVAISLTSTIAFECCDGHHPPPVETPACKCDAWYGFAGNNGHNMLHPVLQNGLRILYVLNGL